MCCFNDKDGFGYFGCIICFESDQIDPKLYRYFDTELVKSLHSMAAEDIADAIETNPRCDNIHMQKKLCETHRQLHTRWQRETGRNNEDWPGSFVGMAPERRKEIVDQNREWVERLKAMKRVDRRQ
jgi:hypothetical protein